MWGTSSMDRVADFESVGWGFESLVPRQRPWDYNDCRVLFFRLLPVIASRSSASWFAHLPHQFPELDEKHHCRRGNSQSIRHRLCQKYRHNFIVKKPR